MKRLKRESVLEDVGDDELAESLVWEEAARSPSGVNPSVEDERTCALAPVLTPDSPVSVLQKKVHTQPAGPPTKRPVTRLNMTSRALPKPARRKKRMTPLNWGGGSFEIWPNACKRPEKR